MGKALEFILAEPWAILPEKLEQIVAIADRHNELPEAVAAKLGRPLDNTRSVQMRGNTAVVPIIGPIFRYANLFTEVSGATSLEVLAQNFTTAAEDDSVDQILLEIDSPGGQASGIAELADMIRATEKPVVAYVGDFGASAAYWLAAAADRVVVSSTALLGSIGMVGTYRTGPKDQIKIISSQSPLKQASPETEAGRAETQRVIDDLADVFISAVAGFRNVSRETVLSDFGQGGILVGEKAVAAGMADAVGSLEVVIAGYSGPTQEGFTMSEKQTPEITRAYLAEHHPDIVQAIENEAMDLGQKEGRGEGAIAERERIQAVMEQTMPGHEALVKGLAFDGTTSGPEAAMQVLAAEKTARASHQQKIAGETPAPVKPLAEVVPISSNLPADERCKQEWDRSPDLRAEFDSLECYIAYTKAVENGQVKILKEGK